MSTDGGIEALARVIAQSITEATKEVAREEARRAALEVLDRASGAQLAREWVSQVEAARVAGVTPQTVREWLEAGLLGERGQRGRVNLERLRAHLAGGTKGAPPMERGRKIAAAVLAAGGTKS